MYPLSNARKRDGGFTLLELLIVVVIIGILVAVAMPNYLKTREKARMSEAVSMLGQIRASEMRYYAQEGFYTGVLAELDFDPTDVAGTPIYSYTISASASNFVTSGSRTTPPAVGVGCVASYDVGISRTGTICGRDCQTAAPWTMALCAP